MKEPVRRSCESRATCCKPMKQALWYSAQLVTEVSALVYICAFKGTACLTLNFKLWGEIILTCMHACILPDSAVSNRTVTDVTASQCTNLQHSPLMTSN
jgi:hypothetical protein